jgi:hypothetical protein
MTGFTSATQIVITLTDSSTVTLPIGSATVTSPTGTTGVAAGDAQGLISTIFRLGYFWDSTQTTLRPVSQIKSITFS